MSSQFIVTCDGCGKRLALGDRWDNLTLLSPDLAPKVADACSLACLAKVLRRWSADEDKVLTEMAADVLEDSREVS